ncbi:DUF3094 family protein [Saccharophagus degradans]|uniref:DUF3094 domain-containing protein n=2 Tax=Saccharophagus degradans TaxID=86304 RepID=Q21FZ1_SACD2|nr:DUF3094 family protein [Saccharophagus degradans]ABD82388.1 conserved hypothetical protein [Saccharophagus degradans 2-40]MBU2985420.1 DUF3094 domain-containing protein [Saccharophagus degradans]MDO6421500.1 DUF3094 family protein [Saccharophagus degradans]MDO6608686.1 DUF3094 family protein [Saccharophagus degradans]WGO99416.1 DUF3094 family protein [Saccharophagus degradans]
MPKLYPEDQQKVDEYLQSSVHQVERAPFRPLRLLAIIGVILLILTGLSFVIAKSQGVA